MKEPKKPSQNNLDSWNQPITAERLVYMLVFLLGYFLIKMAGGKIIELWKDAHPSISNPFPTSSAQYEQFNRFSQRASQLPEIKELLKAGGSEDNASLKAMELTRIGLRKLDTPSLVRRAELVSLVLSKVDTKTCAAMVMQPSLDKQVQSQFYLAIEQLDSKTSGDYFDLVFTALERSNQKNPEFTIAIDPKNLEEAFQKLFTAVPSQDRERFSQVLGSLNDPSKKVNATNEDICWAGRILYEQTLKLEPQYKNLLARAFVQE
jgi:hypothetical protein